MGRRIIVTQGTVTDGGSCLLASDRREYRVRYFDADRKARAAGQGPDLECQRHAGQLADVRDL